MRIIIICVVLLMARHIVFLISLLPISIINRFFYSQKKKRWDTNDVTFNKDGVASNTARDGWLGFLGRSCISYIDYISRKTGFISFHACRMLIYKKVFLMKCDKGVFIHYGLELMGGESIHIGEGTIIGETATLDGRNGLYIGKNVNFSKSVRVFTNQHDYRSEKFDSYDTQTKRVVIGDRCWLGPNVIVLPGVTIGEGAVIGAGSVVVNDIEPWTVNVGIPAKKTRNRPKGLAYELKTKAVLFW